MAFTSSLSFLASELLIIVALEHRHRLESGRRSRGPPARDAMSSWHDGSTSSERLPVSARFEFLGFPIWGFISIGRFTSNLFAFLAQ
jgi:hypothetical protein